MCVTRRTLAKPQGLKVSGPSRPWCKPSANTPPQSAPNQPEKSGRELSSPADCRSKFCCVTRYCGTYVKNTGSPKPLMMVHKAMPHTTFCRSCNHKQSLRIALLCHRQLAEMSSVQYCTYHCKPHSETELLLDHRAFGLIELVNQVCNHKQYEMSKTTFRRLIGSKMLVNQSV